MAIHLLADHVLGVLVLHSQVLPEAQSLRFQPGFLKFDQYEVVVAVVVSHGGGEVDAENGKGVALVVGILVWPHLHLHDVLLQ